MNWRNSPFNTPGDKGWFGLPGWYPFGRAVAMEIGVRASNSWLDEGGGGIRRWLGDEIGGTSEERDAGESGMIFIYRSVKEICRRN